MPSAAIVGRTYSSTGSDCPSRPFVFLAMMQHLSVGRPTGCRGRFCEPRRTGRPNAVAIPRFRQVSLTDLPRARSRQAVVPFGVHLCHVRLGMSKADFCGFQAEPPADFRRRRMPQLIWKPMVLGVPPLDRLRITSNLHGDRKRLEAGTGHGPAVAQGGVLVACGSLGATVPIRAAGVPATQWGLAIRVADR